MTKIIDGTDLVMGRLASHVAKEALKGEEIVILNCDKIRISGTKENIQAEFLETRKKVGSGQRGPKISRVSEKIVKRCIRGMLPNASEGRGKEALKRIMCYNKVPKEFADKKTIQLEKKHLNRFTTVKEIIR